MSKARADGESSKLDDKFGLTELPPYSRMSGAHSYRWAWTEKGRLASIQKLLKEAARDELSLIRAEAF